MTSSSHLRAVVIGTTGQLATALFRRPRDPQLSFARPTKVDVADRSATFRLLDSEQAQLVINASAYTAVDRAESEPERAFAVNETGPRWLAEWCDLNGAALIHVSTDYVFDGAQSAPYREGDATNPLCVYGASKLAGECQVRDLLREHVIVRTSWVFSAHGTNFVKTMLRLAGEREELRVVCDQRGRPTAADDLADALLRVAGRIATDTAHFGTYHFAGASSTNWFEFASRIIEEQARFTQRRPRVVPIGTSEYPTPAKRPPNSVLDTSAFEAAYAYHPRSLDETLKQVLNDLLAAS